MGKDLTPGQIVAEKYEVLEKIAPGGASTVYRVRQLGLKIERALKVLDPHVPDAQLELFEHTFAQEISLLADVTHNNIVKILDYGEDRNTNDESNELFKFFVMEYISGGTIGEVVEKLESSQDLISLIEDVLDGLCYLHDRFILHGDIKPSNILVSVSDGANKRLEAKIADLGVAKPLADLFSPQQTLSLEFDSMTYLWGTHKYSPKYALDILNKKQIRRDALRSFFPALDLYCIGTTLAEVLSQSHARVHVGTELEELLDQPKGIVLSLSEDVHNYIVEFVRRLVVEDTSNGFRNATAARSAFAKMEPLRLISADIPELTEIGSQYAITHNGRQRKYPKRVYNLICHPAFQRLQKLNQLAFVYLLYPDARHSRFSHCLSTFDYAVRISRHLLGDHVFRLYMGPEEISRFLCTALLHDLGHYPLAHVIEDIRRGFSLSAIQTNKSQPGRDMPVKADYEMLPYFLDLKAEGWTETIGDRIRNDWQIEEDTVVHILDKHFPSSELSNQDLLIRDLLDSAIDIDKIAYLRSDSTFSGVSYGAGIDVDSLIASMLCLSPRTHDIDRLLIAISDKGITAAESLIIARHHMFSKVYWHHTNRAVMAMTRYVVERLLMDCKNEYDFYLFLDKVKFMSDMEALSLLSERFDKMCSEKGPNWRNPVKGIVDGSRTLYKRLVSFSQHPENKDIRVVHQYLGRCSPAELEDLRQEIIKLVEKKIGREIKDSDLLIDVPQLDKEHDSLAETYVTDPYCKTGVIRLRELSKLIGAVFDEFQALVKKSRVFVHPEIRKDLRNRGYEEETQRKVIELLSQAARSKT